MKRLIGLLLLVLTLMLTGCWEATDYELAQDAADAASCRRRSWPNRPSSKNWFYREFGDPATFPDLLEATDQDTVLAVAAWVNALDHESPATHRYQRRPVKRWTPRAGDTSSLAWLNFHTCRANGITSVSVELVEWDDGTEEYFCAWRDAGSVYLIAADTLVIADDLLGGIGHLAYGFDVIDYWTY